MSISQAAKNAAAQEAGKPATPLVAVEDLHELVSQYDFQSITPRQLSMLANRLFSRGELTVEEAASMTATEMDTVVERDPNEPIDMKAHFDWMESIRTEEAKSDHMLDYARWYRQQASNILADLMSFATDSREHIHR